MVVRPVHEKKVKDRQTQIGRCMNVEHEVAERKAHDWRERFNVDAKIDAHRIEFLGVMTESKFIWDDHIHCMSITKQRIDLTSDKNSTLCTV